MTSPEQAIEADPHALLTQEVRAREGVPEQAAPEEEVADGIRSAEQAQEKAEVVADQVATEVRQTPGRLQEYLDSIFSFLGSEGGREQFAQVAESVARSVEQRMRTIDGAGPRLREADRAFYVGSRHHLDALYGGVRTLNARYGRTSSPHDKVLEWMQRSAETGEAYGQYLEDPASTGGDPDHAHRRSFTDTLAALSGAVHDNRDELGRLLRTMTGRQQAVAPSPQLETFPDTALEASPVPESAGRVVSEPRDAPLPEAPVPSDEAPPQIATPQEQSAPFVPSSEWREIPPGAAVPPGGSFRMGLEEGGKTYGRWEDLPPQAPEQPNV